MPGKLTVSMIFLMGISVIIAGCAPTTTTYSVTLRYPATLVSPPPSRSPSVTIGLQPFEHLSSDKFTLGQRDTGKDKELYVSLPKPVAEAFTEAAQAYLLERFTNVRLISGWDHKSETLTELGNGLDMVVTGQIKRLFCKAEKKFSRTHLVMEGEVVFIIGNVRNAQVTTKPVTIRNERTEVIFDQQKMERLINESIADLLQTGLGQLHPQ